MPFGGNSPIASTRVKRNSFMPGFFFWDRFKIQPSRLCKLFWIVGPLFQYLVWFNSHFQIDFKTKHILLSSTRGHISAGCCHKRLSIPCCRWQASGFWFRSGRMFKFCRHAEVVSSYNPLIIFMEWRVNQSPKMDRYFRAPSHVKTRPLNPNPWEKNPYLWKDQRMQNGCLIG